MTIHYETHAQEKGHAPQAERSGRKHLRGKVRAALAETREKAGLIVEGLAEVTGLPTRTLYDWESTKSSPPVKYLPQLAEALGVTLRILMPKE